MYVIVYKEIVNQNKTILSGRALFGAPFTLENQMIKYTTPTISLIVEGADITAHDIYVTLEQGTNELIKKGSDLNVSTEEDGTKIIFTLTQEESASFDYNNRAAVQVNWITSQGVRSATEIKSIGVMRNLLDKVVNYGD